MPAKPMYRPFSQNNRLLWAFLLVLGLTVGVQAQSLVNTAHAFPNQNSQKIPKK